MTASSFIANSPLSLRNPHSAAQQRCHVRGQFTNVLKRRRSYAAHAQAAKVQASQTQALPFPQDPFDFILDDPSQSILSPNSPGHCPILVYIPGLDGASLPEHQRIGLRNDYSIVSMCHSSLDRSDWETLVNAAEPTLKILASNGPVTLLGESFGGALALRMAAAFPDYISRLVLLNSGTAFAHSRLVNLVSSFLPVLALDRTERILYKAAAIILFQAFLTNEDRLAEGCIPNEPRWLRSVNIDQVPLQATIHRVQLLRHFSDTFTDRCIQELVHAPTLLLASGADRLLGSREEAARLAGLLTNVDGVMVLEESAHAALLEKEVNLIDILGKGSQHGPEKRRKRKVRPAEDPLRSPQDVSYAQAVESGKKVFEPWRQLTAPLVLGKENVAGGIRTAQEDQSRPVLFVGNHGVFGILDLSVLYLELHDMLEGGRLRSLADPIHFDLFSDISGGHWERFVTDLGGVPATPRNFYRLLSEGENVLLFPGGAREVCRRRGENYRLFWKEDVDFLRPAAKFDAVIVPFSTIGADDSVDILMDGQELQKVPYLGDMVKRFLDERRLSRANLMPIASFPPKPNRFYFKFHEPIDTRDIDPRDVAACKKAYRQTKNVVENGIQELLAHREDDPEKAWNSRLRKQVFSRGLPKPASIPQAILRSLLPDFEL